MGRTDHALLKLAVAAQAVAALGAHRVVAEFPFVLALCMTRHRGFEICVGLVTRTRAEKESCMTVARTCLRSHDARHASADHQ